MFWVGKKCNDLMNVSLSAVYDLNKRGINYVENK